MSCVCQQCGRDYKVDLIIPSDFWERIKPEGKSKREGCLCGSCIMSNIEDFNQHGVFIVSNAILME